VNSRRPLRSKPSRAGEGHGAGGRRARHRRREHVGVLEVEVARAAQIVANDEQLLLREIGHSRARRCGEPAVDPLAGLLALRRELDEDAPPIVLVADAAGVAGPLDAVERGRYRTRGESAVVGQLAGRHGAVTVKGIEAAEVGLVDVEGCGGSLVEGVGGHAHLGHLLGDLVDERVLRVVC
jgi:hypothetical protein